MLLKFWSLDLVAEDLIHPATTVYDVLTLT